MKLRNLFRTVQEAMEEAMEEEYTCIDNTIWFYNQYLDKVYYSALENRRKYVIEEAHFVDINKPIAFESTDTLRLRYAKLRGLILYEI